ncbi:cytidylyltransferase domain-containing protein [Candidatus Terasakiella magnetica]|nr:glycosyltransferase family protein [Candidatus Terasakiella magnetica]
MRTVVIIQARFGSTRLPGKTLEKIGPISALHHAIARCQRIKGIDDVCCAIPDLAQDDAIAREAEKCGTTVVRGPQDDVLKRYRMAADATQAKTIIRITSDCPLVDPDISSQTLKLFEQSGADFACNNAPPSWPHGFDTEVTSYEWLRRADDEATEPFHREHVMPFIRTHSDIKLVNLPSPTDLRQHRWTLDYPEDLEFFRALAQKLPDLVNATTDDILKLLEKQPEISEINHHLHDKSR